MHKLWIIFFLPMSLLATPIVIGISGGTGSGKTTLAKKIKEKFLDDAVILSQDAYYKDLSHLPVEKREHVNFDHPKSIDFDLLKKQLIQLKNGQKIEQPNYDFITHTRSKKTKTIESKRIIIVEGILLLSINELRDMFDLKIYMDTDDDVRLLRRIERDMHERGRCFDSIKEQYQDTVKPMHLAFVEPNKKYADIIVPAGGKNNRALEMITSRLKEVLLKQQSLEELPH